MYEEWFEKIAKSLNITEVIDNDKMIDITLPKELSDQIKGDELFLEAYNISRHFKLNYRHNCIHLILEKNKLDKHYLMYLIGILLKIKKMIHK